MLEAYNVESARACSRFDSYADVCVCSLSHCIALPICSYPSATQSDTFTDNKAAFDHGTLQSDVDWEVHSCPDG